jgi:ABC-2 type transport system permease protein
MGVVGAVVQISRVELLRFLRERSNIFFVFVLPLALVIFIGLQFGGGMGTQVGAVAGDDDAAAELIERLDAADGIEVVPIDDEDELRSLVSRGNLSGGVLIPDGYEDALRSGATFEIGFLGRPDAAAQSLRTVVDAVVADQAAISGAATLAADATDQSVADLASLATQVRDGMPGVTVSTEAVGGDELMQELGALGQFDLGASSQLFLFVFLTSLASSAALIQTRQYGVATRMLSTPTRLPVILAGLAGGRFVVALFQALYIIVVTAVGFGVDWGDPLTTSVLVLLFCLVSTGAAMVLGSLFRNDSQASGAGVGLGLVFGALGGSMMALDFFPEGMLRIAMLTPHGWANTAMAEIVRRDAGIVDVATELAVLAGFAVVLLGAATVLLRRALTR